MKPILIGLAAFAISLAGTTAAMVKLHKPVPGPVVVADKGHRPPADSVTKAGSHDSSTRKAADTAKVAPAAAHDSAVAVKHDTIVARPDSATGTAAGPAPSLAARAARLTDPKERQAAFKQVARIFSAMKAPEAAKVLAYLTDEEVEGILRAVGPRQAADFMTNMPKERAAVLSRRLLVPKEASSS